MSPFVSMRSFFATCLAGAFTLFVPMAAAVTDSPRDSVASDDWELKAEAYGWLPVIKGTAPTGDDIEITLSDLIDTLDFTFMGAFKASKGKWSLVTDLVYLKISADDVGKTTIPLGPLDIPTRVKAGAGMKAWIVNLVGSYNLLRTEKATLEVLAGARYLSLDVDFSVDVGVLPGSAQGSGSDHVWDAIIGVRGLAFLSDKWYLNYRFDIGTGVSDLTWNAAVQFGRRYNWGSLMLGYRYLHYDFDSDFEILKDLDVHGPLIGAAWEF